MKTLSQRHGCSVCLVLPWQRASARTIYKYIFFFGIFVHFVRYHRSPQAHIRRVLHCGCVHQQIVHQQQQLHKNNNKKQNPKGLCEPIYRAQCSLCNKENNEIIKMCQRTTSVSLPHFFRHFLTHCLFDEFKMAHPKISLILSSKYFL